MEITFKDGAVQQSNFHDHGVLRFNEMPSVQVTIMKSDAKPGGMGEPAVPPVAPALANALAILTGKRHYSMPISIKS
jgi:isoquinoline 1-oxidoreductase beta subunit